MYGLTIEGPPDTIWFAADFHYGHENMVYALSKWNNKDGARRFDTIEAMNETIVEGVNNNVKEDHILFFLGDWSFGGIDNIRKLREQLKVKTIYFIIGNHDHHIRRNKDQVRQLFKKVADYAQVRINGRYVILSHFPMLAWENSFKGAWMLHGHAHGTLPKSNTVQWAGDNIFVHTGKIMDVGIDATYKRIGEYRPISFKEVSEYMETRPLTFVEKRVIG